MRLRSMKTPTKKNSTSPRQLNELEKYLKYFFSLFTKEEKALWVEENADLLEILDKKERKDKFNEDIN